MLDMLFHVPLSRSSDDFIKFFINKNESTREKIHTILSTNAIGSLSTNTALEVAIELNLCLNYFCLVKLSE